MNIITSTTNERIKYYKKLKQKKYRDLEGLFIIETKHLIDEALTSKLLEVIITTDYKYLNNDCEVIYVDNKVMSSLTNFKSSSDYLGVVKYLDNDIDYSAPLVVLDNVQDPGNVGTILRNALAFNIRNIILGHDCVDIYNAKVIQASQGAIFSLNFKNCDLINEIDNLKKNSYTLIGTALNNSKVLSKDDIYTDKMAFFLGNEGQGLKEDIINKMDINYRISINNIDSLNVSSASAIIFYQFLGKN